MDKDQRVAFVQSQIVCAQAEIAAMQAANTYREMRGHTIAYDEAAFAAVPARYGLEHNAVLSYLMGDG